MQLRRDAKLGPDGLWMDVLRGLTYAKADRPSERLK
jgi:hypothetical protein